MPRSKVLRNACPTCGGDMWDNREGKRNPKAPDYKCCDKNCDGVYWPGDEVVITQHADGRKTTFKRDEGAQNNPQTRQDAVKPLEQTGDGVLDTRKHLMKVANLYALCVKAVDHAIAPHVPEMLRTSEWLQAAVASLFIESSSRRTTDGVNWWSYVDKMPDKPLPNQDGGKRSVGRAEATQENENDEPLPF